MPDRDVEPLFDSQGGRVRRARDGMVARLNGWAVEVVPCGADTIVVYLADGRSYEMTLRERLA
jgi:hypothetical protein